MVIQTVYQQTSLSTPISETCTWCVGLPCMWGSGPHMLGSQVSYIKKKRSGKEKQREEKREKKTHMSKFHQQVNLASSVVWLSWNLEKRFKTRVATIWTVKIRFWARAPVLLLVNSNDVFGYSFSNFFFVSFAIWCIW